MIVHSFLYLIYGSAWIVWLASLRSPLALRTPCPDGNIEDMKCSQVRPLLATFLYVLAWLFLVTLVLALLFLTLLGRSSVTPSASAACTGSGVLFMLLMIGIFALQIRYIDDIRKSTRTIKEDCTQTHKYRRGVVYAFAIFMFVVGITTLLFVSTVVDAKHDIATMIALRKNAPAIRRQLLKRVAK